MIISTLVSIGRVVSISVGIAIRVPIGVAVCRIVSRGIANDWQVNGMVFISIRKSVKIGLFCDAVSVECKSVRRGDSIPVPVDVSVGVAICVSSIVVPIDGVDIGIR